MRVVIELLLLASVIAFGAVYAPIALKKLRQRKRPVALPEAPAEAKRLAAGDERLAEAVELRDKIAGLARKKDVGLDRAVVDEVDELLRAMVSLRELKLELAHHLSILPERRIAEDAALLDAATVEAQRRQIAELRQRERGLDAELARAAAGLRETWLGLLEALAQPGNHALASNRVKEQVETLRIRIQAEQEARAALPETVET